MTSLARRSAVLILSGLAVATSAAAQRRPAPSAAPAPVEQPPAFAGLKYRLVGPYDGGRASRATGVPGDPATYYLATASGGVWKSTDGGVRWNPIFDDQPIASIGSIAVAPSDPNVVYVGSGEANIRGNVQPGNGIYKSTDAGKTWSHVWTQEGQIGTMIVHPKNPDVAFAAVLGRAFAPNPERGVYRTTDGGKSWTQVLKKDDKAGASDVALDPNNPRIVFAGFWETRRYPWDLVSGGPGSGLYRSRDGGDTWTQLAGRGLPRGIWGKVGVAVAPSNGSRVYALIEADSGGLFRSEDGGDSWTLINDSRLVRQRAWYYTTMTVNPANQDEVWFPQVPMLRTIDGGKTLTFVQNVPHGDNHDVWFDPANPKRMIVANDGGGAVTVNGGESWLAARPPIGQCYHIAADNRTPYHVACAEQDLGTAQGPSHSLTRGGIGASLWIDVGGGEAGHIVSRADDPNIVFAGEYLGIITRYDDRTGQTRNVSAYPENPSGHGAEDAKYRFQWTAPIAASPHDPNVIYHAAQVLFKTTDGGQSWTAISGDLTRNDKAKQRWAGGPITGDNTGVEFYATIFAVAESPKQAGVIWTGSDDGLVQVTRDGGRTWTNVTSAMPGFPEWGTVSLIEASPHDAATAYVVVKNYRLGDNAPYLYRTTDFGATWKRLDAGLPRDVWLHAVREDPIRRGLLYVGTQLGVVFSPDDGTTWRKLQLNLPPVQVADLIVKENDLVLGTHGRSIWILDDLTPVREWSDAIAAKPLHLFAPEAATAWIYRSSTGDAQTGQNPPYGANLNYYLRDSVPGELTLDVLDPAGAVVRRFSSTARPPDGHSEYEEPPEPDLVRTPGIHRMAWDLQAEGAKRIPGGMIDTGDPAEGPRVPPGRYRLRLATTTDTTVATVDVRLDPRASVPAADLAAQAAFTAELRDALDRLADGVARLRDIRKQLDERNTALAGNNAARDLVAQSKALIVKLDTLETRFHNPDAKVTYDILAFRGGSRLYSRLTPLYNWASEGRGAPTQGMRDAWAGQRQELDQYLGELRVLIDRDLAAINSAAGRLGLGHVIVPAPGQVP
ncbi:MAG: WD40/YVTN/BNR-like repeat-containing protein [Gemmatimonadales bacterium]